MFINVVEHWDGVGTEQCHGMFVVVGGAKVDLALTEFFCPEFGSETPQAFFTEDYCIAGGVTPVEIIERTCTVGEVSKNEVYGVGDVPIELDSVKVECVETVVGSHGRTVSVIMAVGFGGLRAIAVREVTMGVGHDGNGEAFVKNCCCRKVDILVCGVDWAKIAIKITTVVSVDRAMKFNFSSECERYRSQGNRQNKFAHKILPKKFRGKDRNISLEKPQRCVWFFCIFYA